MISDVVIVVVTSNFNNDLVSILAENLEILSSSCVSPQCGDTSGVSGTRVDVESEDELAGGFGISKLCSEPGELISWFCGLPGEIVKGIVVESV